MSAQDIQKLREITGAGVMDCKRAYEEADKNFDKAIALIKEKGLSKVEKRADRETGAGMVYSYVHNGRIGVLVEVRAETDFVVRSEPFQELVRNVAMQVAAMGGANTEELLAQPFIKDESRTIKDLVNEVIAKTGENIKVNQFYRIET